MIFDPSWVGKIPPKIPNFSFFCFPLDKKISARQIKDGPAPYLLQVKSLLRLGPSYIT